MPANKQVLAPTYDLDEIERVATKASQGKWHVARTAEEYCSWWGPTDEPNEHETACVILSERKDAFAIGATCDDRLPSEQNIADAAYIAALNPAVVLQMVKDHRDLEEVIVFLANGLRSIGDNANDAFMARRNAHSIVSQARKRWPSVLAREWPEVLTRIGGTSK